MSSTTDHNHQCKTKNWGLIRPIHHPIKRRKSITKITTQKFTIKAVHVHVKNQTVWLIDKVQKNKRDKYGNPVSIRSSWLHDLGTSRKRSEAPNFMIWGLEDQNCTEGPRRVFTIVRMESWCISCKPRISIYPYFESVFRASLMKPLSLLRQCENCESGISACQDRKKKGIGEDNL